MPWLGDLLDGRAPISRETPAWPTGLGVVLGLLGTFASQRSLIESFLDEGTVRLLAPLAVPAALSVAAGWIFMARKPDGGRAPVLCYAHPTSARQIAKVVHLLLAALALSKLPSVIPDPPRTLEGFVCYSRTAGPVGEITVEALDASGTRLAKSDRPTSTYDGYFRVRIEHAHFPWSGLRVHPPNGPSFQRSLAQLELGIGCAQSPSESGIEGWVIYVEGE